ncbi:hypothetical protein HMPREF3232_00945 [Fannyhessea vaginae]|nr:hypothetical protein HMPREF3232_00945 [Fannyhessea vaginae]
MQVCCKFSKFRLHGKLSCVKIFKNLKNLSIYSCIFLADYFYFHSSYGFSFF